MWNDFRPLTASAETQLQDLMRLEEFLRRLDNLLISADSLLHIANAKQQLVEIYRSILAGSSNDMITFDQLDSQIVALESTAVGDLEVAGHFTGAFRSILQFSKASNLRLLHPLLGSLANSASVLEEVGSAGRSIPQAFVSVLEIASPTSPDQKWDAWRDNFGLTLVGKVLTSEEQSISSMDWSRVEIKTLLQTLSSFGMSFNSEIVLRGLRHELRSVLLGTLLCHDHLLSEDDRARLSRHSLMDSRLEFAHEVHSSHYFRTAYEDYLLEPLAWLSSTEAASIAQTGAAFVSVCLGLLRIFVPDQPYDPALTLQVAHTNFKRRRTYIKNLLAAQKIFELAFTGQGTSILTRMSEEELLSIGEEPVVAAVLRTPGNGLDLLAVEFSNLLRAIVDNRPETILMAALPGRWQAENVRNEDALVEAEKLLQTIDHILKRLKLVDRAFDDLTRPVTWILQCLTLGTRMLIADQSSLSQVSKSLQQRAKRIPLLSSEPEEIMNAPLPTAESTALNTEKQLDWLEHLAISSSMERAGHAQKWNKFQNLLTVIDQMYETWKANLEKDQDAAVARSKYYAYRGDDDLDESQETEAVSQMFPTFDESHQAEAKTQAIEPGKNAELTAVRLAKLQQRLFSVDSSTADLEGYIDLSLAYLSTHASNQSFELGPVPSQDLMPAVLLKLDQKMSALDATERRERINIYTDGDAVEARRLHDVVKSIMANFNKIHAAWPEHAVPVEVLDFCREVLKFSLKDAIAKLLTKTEKLLSIVGQWQAVASREFSAAENVDELTKLIIRWRQLELSSWSGLLDLEQTKVEAKAQSWYFMLYEAIIANPRQILDQEEDLHAYLKELARTLEEFLTSTSCGEFPYRLQLCQSFQRFLSALAVGDKTLQPVLSCVGNLVRHHERYQQLADSALAKGRSELEKKLREQIKLASWKDTNVSALRESARRSHFKLFKIVRKYRTLLSQPLQPQVSTVRGAENITTSVTVDLLSQNIPSVAVDSALVVVSETLSEWNKRPERLRNPSGAAARMKLLVRRDGDGFLASKELYQFVTSFLASTKDLRSRTPSALTEDNQSLINHLKGLKQTLFSDTLRFIKHMGVQRDLGSIQLEKQISRAVIYADVASLTSTTYAQICTNADNDFAAILDLMPAVRSVLTEHSDQVRVVDVRRSVSYADGLLAILIQQRQSVAACEQNISVLNGVVERLGSFARQPIDQFQHASPGFKSKQEALTRRISWLPELLAVSVKVLDVQSKYSDADLAGLTGTLLDYKGKIERHLVDIRSLPLLSADICSQAEKGLAADVEHTLSNLKRDIAEISIKYPHSATLLQKLAPWTDISNVEIEMAVNGFHQPNFVEVDGKICKCLDMMFEAVQDISAVSERLPGSIETNGWLSKTNRRQVEMMELLQIPNIAEKLRCVEADLTHVSPDDLSISIALLVISLPIVEQYLMVCQYVAGQALALHCESARLTVVLVRTLITIGKEGFCSPQEASKGEEQSGPVESGTGLGDGTGADDISKDVDDDEDLSELAQMENENPESQELEASKDAVNMDKDDLKGDDGDAEEASDNEDASSQSGTEEGSDLDEETGSVDNLDPSAVDEKMWEGLDAEKDKALENKKASGEQSDEQTAKQEKQTKGEDEEQDENAEGASEEGSIDSDDEGEGVGRDEMDQAEANMQEEKPLELPDEMQLNGEEDGEKDDISDGEMGELSDVEDEVDPAKPNEDELDEEATEDAMERLDESARDDEQIEDDQETEEPGKGEEDEIIEDQPEPETNEEAHDHDTRNDNMTYDIDEDQDGEMGEGGAIDNEDNVVDVSREKAAGKKSEQAQEQPEDTTNDTENEKGNDETGGVTRGGRSDAETASPQVEALKKLGDMLERWHQRREIHQATNDHAEQADDIDMADADFEHLQNEEDKGDAQALGTASKEQAQTLDQSKAIEDEGAHGDTEEAPADVAEEDQPVQESMVERFSQLQTNPELQQDSGPGAIMPHRKHESDHANEHHERDASMDDEDPDITLLNDRLATEAPDLRMSQAEASQLWSHYSSKVQHISLILTEQLRLILAPTLATKLRGDFRTGKRLNIKRIIPYIASGYKRDKIWMRRSVPSKRNYQIMLALDDSKSMMEGGAGALAFETLAMLCKSLSMLEVGDLCVVGFGKEEHIRVAHPFGQPFGNEAGVKIFQNFTFDQTATDVKKLVKESAELFQDARARSTGSQSELWQLQLIISDGICEDHEVVSRLVRQAKEEKIMIVFVIVDGRGESILDLKQASFEADETGEMKLSMRRYLDRFPFPYYLVVRDVRDLPAVLATALKGWFAQVVDVQG